MSITTDNPDVRLVFGWLAALSAGNPAAVPEAADQLARGAENDAWYMHVVDRLKWSLYEGTGRATPEERLLKELFGDADDRGFEHAFQDLRNAELAVKLVETERDRVVVTAQLLRCAQALAEWRRVIEPQGDTSWLVEAALHSIAYTDDELSPMAIAEWHVSVARERRRTEQVLRRRVN